MKIFNVQPNLFFTTPNNTKRNEALSFGLRLKQLDRDTVSFGRKLTLENYMDYIPNEISIDSLKDLPDVSCIYCGQPMISIKERDKLINVLGRACGRDLEFHLKSHKKYLRGFKKTLVDDIIAYSQRYSHYGLNELLTKMYPTYLKVLEKEQNDVLRYIQDKYSGKFSSPEANKQFEIFLYDTNRWINEEDGAFPFRIKIFKSELHNLLGSRPFKNESIVQSIYDDVDTLPKAIDNESAFVVKYHRRSPREIATQLFREAYVTEEHIKPQSKGGLTTSSNLSLACASCNHARSSIPMDIWIDENPNVEANIKKHLDKLPNKAIYYKTKGTKKRLLEVFSKYISDIAKTYMRESKGTLHLEKYIKNTEIQ